MIRCGPALLLIAGLAPAVAGCGQLFLESNLDSGPEGLYVTEIEPHYGPTTGGNTVTITGGGFLGDVTVEFGNAVADVTVVDSENLTVVAPDAGGMELTVDLSVRSDLGAVSVEDGYVFSDSHVPDPDDTSTEIDGIGGVIEFSHVQVACTTCFDPPADAVSVAAFGAFHNATSATWTDWLPEPGTCSTTAGSSQPTSSFLDVGSHVYLTAGSESIVLTRTTAGANPQYDAGMLTDSDFQRNTAFDLESADGGDWGPFTVVDAVVTEDMFSTIEPFQMLFVQPQDAFFPALSRGGTTITYQPYSTMDYVVVLLGLYSGSNGAFLGSLMCVDTDSGAISLPSNYMSAYPQGTLAAVYLYRYEIEWTAMEVSGSYLESVVSVGVVGTATVM